MSTTPLRVLIADDHVAIRAGVRFALEAAGVDVCAEVGSADAAIVAASEHRPDICLIDLSMPGDGLRAVAEIARKVPGTRVVVLTVSTATSDLVAALRSGAVGYLLKEMDPSRLPDALAAAAAGEVAIPRRLTGRLAELLQYPSASRHHMTDGEGRAVELTPREWQVLELLASDQSTAEIAMALELDQVTVRRHVSGVVHKLGVNTRGEAVDLLNSARTTD